MEMITVIQRYWTGMFNEEINWHYCNINVEDILSIEPKEIYIEDLTLLSHFKHNAKFLKALGSTVVTRKGEVTTLQSPDEIHQLIEQKDTNSKTLDYSDLDEYLDMKARSYQLNNYIFAERDRQTRSIEKQNKMIKWFCLFMTVIFISFSLIYPQQSYEFVKDLMIDIANAIDKILKVFISSYLS